MTRLEELRWKLNKSQSDPLKGIYSAYRKGGFIQKGKEPLTKDEIEFISTIAEANRISIQIDRNRVYIIE